MAVYVDDMLMPFGRMKMCHMVADTSDELHAMAERIGVARRWAQYPGTPAEHYDISKGKREIALAHGAVAIPWRELPVLLERMGRGHRATSWARMAEAHGRNE